MPPEAGHLVYLPLASRQCWLLDVVVLLVVGDLTNLPLASRQLPPLLVEVVWVDLAVVEVVAPPVAALAGPAASRVSAAAAANRGEIFDMGVSPMAPPPSRANGDAARWFRLPA